jgi:hypothetical protein
MASIAPTLPSNFNLLSELGPQENVSRLGPCKLGVTRKQIVNVHASQSGSAPVINRIQSRQIQSRQIQHHSASTTTGQTGQHFFATGNPDALNQQSLNTILSRESSSTGIPVSELKQQLIEFSPLAYLQNRPMSMLKNSPYWRIYASIAKLPNSSEVLALTGLRFKPNAEQQRLLTLLARASDAELNIQNRNDEVRIRAVQHCLDQLNGRNNLARENAWACNSFRNGLHNTGNDSTFLEIDARLCKLGTWIKRSENQAWYKLRMPLLKKTPFGAMKFGYMGADRTDIRIHTNNFNTALQSALTEIKKFHTQQLDELAYNPYFRYASRDKAKKQKLVKQLEKFEAWATTLSQPSGSRGHLRILKHFEAINGKLNRAGFVKRRTVIDESIQQMREAVGKNIKHHPQRPNRDQILSHLEHVIDRIQGASRVRFVAGGVAGFGTKGVSAVVSNIVSSLLLRVKLDVRWLRMRTAGIELAMPPYNLELHLYSSTARHTQAGLGAAVGPSVGPLEVTAGAYAKPWSREQRQDRGVVLRMPRERGKEAELKVRFKAMLQDLMELSQGSVNDGSILRTLLARYPELSVNLIGSAGENKQSMAAGVEANAGVKFGIGKVAAHAEQGGHFHSRIERHHIDQNGAIQVHRNVTGKRFQAVAEARLETRIAGMSEPIRLNVASLDGLGGSSDWANAGRHIKRDIVYQDGKISSMSFYEIEYQSFSDFRKSVLDRLDIWASEKAAQAGKSMDTTRREILEFLNDTEKHLQVTHTFAARCELRPNIAREIDALHGLIELHDQSENDFEKLIPNSARQRIEVLLNSKSSYRETSFRVYDRSDITQQNGLHAAARLESIQQAEGVYAHSRLM